MVSAAAELSSSPCPSRPARTPSTSLLTLPTEILTQICQHVFTWHRSYELIRTPPANEEEGDDNEDAQAEYAYAFTSWPPSSYNSYAVTTLSPLYLDADDTPKLVDDHETAPNQGYCLPQHALALLRTHSHLHHIGSKVFYSTFAWGCFRAESFRIRFSRHIGSLNLSYVKDLRLVLSNALVCLPSHCLPGWISLLRSMPGLERFEMSKAFGRWWRPNTWEVEDNWTEQHRALLWLAAWVTKRVEGMEYAVWNEEGTVSESNTLDAERAPYWDTRYVRLEVVMTRRKPCQRWRVYEDPIKIEARNKSEPAARQEEVLPVIGVLLDSAKIRETGWEGLGSRQRCRPYPYQMGVHAATSENNAADVEEQLGEMDPNDQGAVDELIEEMFRYDDQAANLVRDIQDGKRYPQLRHLVERMYARHRRLHQVVMDVELGKHIARVVPVPAPYMETREPEPVNPTYDGMMNSESAWSEAEEWGTADEDVGSWQLVRDVLKQRTKDRIDRWKWKANEVLMKLKLRRRPWYREPRWTSSGQEDW